MNMISHYKNIGYLWLARRNEFLLKRTKVFPLTASIKITEKCNSKCITCNVWKKNADNKNENELSTKEIIQIEKELADNGCKSIRFTGGEPLLRSDIGEIITSANECGLKTSITTNGLLLSQRLNALLELDKLVISIDGLKETNDKIRGIDGDFKKSIEGIKRLKSKSETDIPSICVATTICSKNSGEIFDLLKLCNRLGVTWFPNLLDSSPYFFRDNEATEVQNSSNIREVMNSIKKAKEKMPETVNLTRYQIDYVEEFLMDETHPRYCILGFKNVKIGSKGDIYSGCWALPPLANVRESTLTQLFTSNNYKKRAIKMFYRNCPECTCGWGSNVKFEHLPTFAFELLSKKLKRRFSYH